MFKNAIVRKPGRSIIKELTNANLGIPDYNKAVEQHDFYVSALRDCGLTVEELDAD